MELSKIWRIICNFEPTSTFDIQADSIFDSIVKITKYLNDQGNNIDESIVISVELISETVEVKDEP